MCGSGRTQDDKMYLYLGYYGGQLEVNGMLYGSGDGEHTTKEEMIKHIKKNYTYEKFLQKLLECVDNGDEG